MIPAARVVPTPMAPVIPLAMIPTVLVPRIRIIVMAIMSMVIPLAAFPVPTSILMPLISAFLMPSIGIMVRFIIPSVPAAMPIGAAGSVDEPALEGVETLLGAVQVADALPASCH